MMEDQSVLRSPQLTAKELDVSSATLRRWSEEFKEFLSDDASAANERTHRRYKDEDTTVLFMVKKLMNEGMTYEQVRHLLRRRDTVTLEPDDIVSEAEADNSMPESLFAHDDLADETDGDEDDRLIVAGNGAESPAIAFLTNTLSTLSDSQKSILNSQAANRELLGVLIQDNFNLKEENNRLRERILDVERDMAKARQEEERRHEALRQELEAKVATSNQLAVEAINTAKSIEVPEIKSVESNPGCLGMLLGKNPKFVTTSRKKSESSKPPVPPTEKPSKHPRPTFPPE